MTDSGWQDYNDEAQRTLSHSYKDAKAVTLAIGKFKYLINFGDSVQSNTKTGKLREIRYAPVERIQPSWKTLDKPEMKPQIGSSGIVAVDKPQWDWAKSQSQECGNKCMIHTVCDPVKYPGKMHVELCGTFSG